ncbi:alpha,alpha-trehalose-phosphate synthase [UDP-forming] 1-like isoform X2 [Humulus lupulus]|uniref:alpha,alpha-trehalose-phosphate synthase [UDP-forming] 1-like isoform X2 n=1 Tax=Humulus lupulus TaxID=3486 RepID=UPI002B40BCED|nr:alpha,alpha-trehalose-phosphate synthase [UDP-forming] 1-like isoform X2 [Humulus lupulus]
MSGIPCLVHGVSFKLLVFVLVVANRLPVSAVRKGEDVWHLEISAGGLVSALLDSDRFIRALELPQVQEHIRELKERFVGRKFYGATTFFIHRSDFSVSLIMLYMKVGEKDS